MLKVLMLRKKLDAILAELEGLRGVDFATREAELAESIEEAATEEERSVVEEAVDAFEAERAENEAAIAKKEEEAEAVRAQIAELEQRQAKAAKNDTTGEAPATERATKEVSTMHDYKTREGRRIAIRSMFQTDESMKVFADGLRSAIKNRAITGGELLVPEIVMPMVKAIVERNSVMLRVVNAKPVNGKGRITISGAIPEAVWTEACGNINELNLDFKATEVDGYKVAGFIPICNALIEDSDVNLVSEAVEALGVAVAKGIDAAIIYGTGNKMPLGIVTRLAQTSEPAGYTGETWVDLHSTHLLSTNATGEALFKAIYDAMGTTVSSYAAGSTFYAMNTATAYKVRGNALGLTNEKTLVLGEITGVLTNIVVCDMIADDDIVMGYGGGYVYSERSGYKFDQSEHVQFLQDNTVFRAKSRGDGKPVIASNFAVLNINNQTPATTRVWPEDYANGEMNVLTVTAAKGSAVGKTVLTVSNAKASASPTYKYLVSGNVNGMPVGAKVGSDWTSLTSGTTAIAAAAGTPIAVVELDGNGRVVSTGVALSDPKVS